MAKNSDARGMNKKGQTVSYGGKKVSFPAKSNVKPTEAITAKGQKATGLGKSDNAKRFKPELSKNIPTSQRGVNALSAAGRFAAESVALGGAGKGISVAGKALGKTLGKRAFEKTGGAAYQAGMERLAGASGMGGRVSRTQTPFGPTLRSTKIGSAAEQSARMGNLAIGAEKQAIRAGQIARTETMKSVAKATTAAKNTAIVAGTAASSTKARKNVNKGRNAKR